MQIFITPTSPYARIARIAAQTCATECETVAIASDQLRTDTNPVLACNPTGRVPTLLDGDVVLSETPAICRYLEAKGDGTRLFARMDDAAENWAGVRLESFSTSLLDGAALWTRELRRPPDQRSDWLCGVEMARAQRTLAWFDADPDIRAGTAPWDYAHITLAIGLEYLVFRGLITDWHESHDALANWLAEQQKRPAMQATDFFAAA